MLSTYRTDGLHALQAREAPMRMCRQGDWTFGMLWTLATTAGWAAGWAIGAAASETEGGPVSAFFGGSLSGALQWQALRKRLSSASWWVAASVLGWGAGVLAGRALKSATAGVVKATVGAPIALALVTTMQWMYLRRQVSQSRWWFLANVAALGVGSGGVLVFSALIGAPLEGAPSWASASVRRLEELSCGFSTIDPSRDDVHEQADPSARPARAC
jgi:hypothetical protein